MDKWTRGIPGLLFLVFLMSWPGLGPVWTLPVANWLNLDWNEKRLLAFEKVTKEGCASNMPSIVKLPHLAGQENLLDP